LIISRFPIPGRLHRAELSASSARTLDRRHL